MTPKEATKLALACKQPEFVPHFELEMQLTEEYFGQKYSNEGDWNAALDSGAKKKLLERDARLLMRTADTFGYGIIFYSWMHRPTREDYNEGIRMLREVDEGRHLLMGHGDSTAAIPDGKDMDTVIINMLMNPDKVKAEQEQRSDEALESAVGQKAAGLDGFGLCSDYCFNSGPFLSPEMFSDLITPYLTKIIRGYRAMGMYTIKHTDGNIMPILDDLISAGPHALHSLDPMAGVDIKEIKRLTAGKLCLIGNVNCALMQTGTDEQILESCKYAMENGRPGGGYIFSTSNIIFKGMPQRSYDMMMEFYKKNNRY